MLGSGSDRELDERTIGEIVERVIAVLRDDLDAFTADLSRPAVAEQLTVDQVARRLGVARSTVYAHWRQWGGYKLGSDERSHIRFDASSLVFGGSSASRDGLPVEPKKRRPVRRRTKRALIATSPRFDAVTSKVR